MSRTGLDLAYQNILTNELTKYRKKTPSRSNTDSVYGRAIEKDAEGASAVINSWKHHIPTKSAPKKADFRSINKMSVRFGLSNSKDFRLFSKTSSSFLKEREGTNAIALVLPTEEFPYGFPNRPSTPLHEVLSGAYGTNAANQSQSLYQQRLQEIKNRAGLQFKPTRNTFLQKETTDKKIMRLNTEGGDREVLFKLKKFHAVPSKVDNLNKEYIFKRVRPETHSGTRSVSLNFPKPRRVAEL